MRLPTALVSRYRAWTTAFMVSGACVKEKESEVMEKRTSPAVRMKYWGSSQSMCIVLGLVTSSMSKVKPNLASAFSVYVCNKNKKKLAPFAIS